MKFSTFIFEKAGTSFEDICDKAVERGFDGVEPRDDKTGLSLLKYGFDKKAAQEVKKMIESKGLEIPDIAHGGVGTTEDDLVLFRKTMELAEVLGVKIIRTHLGPLARQWASEIPKSELLKITVDSLKNLQKAADLAEDYGVKIGVDNFYSLTVKDNINYVKKIDSPNLKILIDVDNCVAHGENLIESVREAGNLLIHSHVKEAKVYGRGENPPLPGYEGKAFGDENHAELGETGLIDWKKYIETLKEIKYKGFLSIEACLVLSEGEQDWDRAERNMNYLRKICEEVGI
ncbi:sugar phosphate isomerase/epimerase [Patescibacteria group bacterium]|nr:sugar phosphate isomerase/epimerase [Patescibacteria group bacterium]